VRLYENALIKRDSILKIGPTVAHLYTQQQSSYATESQLLAERDSVLRAFEIAVDILLPKKFRDMIVRGESINWGYKFREYDFHDVAQIEMIHPYWWSIHPIVTKGVIIGSNGLGDHVVLLLKSDSAYELGSQVYLLEHELGQIVPSVDLDSIHK
jgi:hypothetical protein